MLTENNQYIRSLQLLRDSVPSFKKYPFNLPFFAGMHELDFHPRVTYVIGENGSGKSTLLESLAVAAGFNAEGGTRNFNFASKSTHSILYDHIRLIRGVKRPQDGFFLRAESFYNFATNVDEIDDDPFSPPLTQSYGGLSLHEQSHGESFFSVFLNRFGGKGLYILDEPEAALSPSRQMSMITRMHQLVNLDSQFIIATHSPIIMAYPDAIIYQIQEGAVKQVEYEETDHYRIMRHFLNNTAQMLDILME